MDKRTQRRIEYAIDHLTASFSTFDFAAKVAANAMLDLSEALSPPDERAQEISDALVARLRR